MGDLRLAVRTLTRSPGFTALAIVLLATGIGFSALLFNALNAVMLRPLPVDRPQQIVRLFQRYPKIGSRDSLPNAFYRTLRDRVKTLSSVFGEVKLDTVLTNPAPAEAIRVGFATPEYFEGLGVRPLYGRTFGDGDRDAMVAVLSYGFWQRRFNGDVQALGRPLFLRGHAFIIMGVLPRKFNGLSVDTAPDVRVPLSALRLLSTYGSMPVDLIEMELAGRLKPGVTPQQAQAECVALWRASVLSIFGAYPDMAEFQLRTGLAIDPAENGISILRERYGPTLQALSALAGVLVAMVCANLAGLLLARGASRETEISVRLALGASPARMIRHILAEPLLLTVAGAAGGLLLAFAAAPLSVRWLPPIRDFANRQLPLTIDLQPDLRVLSVSVVVALATALLFGLGPAFALARTDVQSVLRRGSASARSSRRQVLVMVQIASCTILLGATALLLRTFEQLVRTRPGFDPDRVVSFTIDPSLAGYTPEQEQALLRQLTAGVQTLPGVTAVGYASRGIMRGRGLGATVAPAGQDARDDFLNVSLNSVSPAYFQTLGVELLAGRTITDADGRNAKPQRVVVNEAFARRFFPNVAPVGQRFGVSRGRGVVEPEYEIVGVVSDAKYRSLREPITPTFYTPFNDSSFVLYVRMATTPESISAPVRRIVGELDSSLPVIEVKTLNEEVRASTAGERLAAALAACFGALGAILAAVGLYALLAYFVAQKRREIGIRMALGATRTNVGLLIGRESFITVACGVAAGLAFLIAFAPPLMGGLLYRISARDTVSLAATAAGVGLVSAVATAVPLLRASRVDPGAALRHE